MLKNKILASSLASLLMAATLLFTSCVPENVSPDADLPEGAILLKSENFRGADGTKLGVDAEGAQVHFVEDDQVWINGAVYPVRVTGNGRAYISRTDNESHFDNFIEGQAIRAVYPARIVSESYNFTLSSTDVKLEFPALYEYRKDPTGYQNVDAPLIAYAANSTDILQFKHLTAAITVAITNNTGAPMQLEKIKISNDAGNHFLAGTPNNPIPFQDATITPYTGYYAVEATQDGNYVIMDFTGTQSLDIEKGSTKYVQIPILPVTGQQLTIEILAKNTLTGVIANKFYYERTQANANFSIAQNQLAYAPADMAIDGDESQYLKVDGTFTIGQKADGTPLKVYFAKGNLLYYVGTNPSADNKTEPTDRNNWRFAGAQDSTFETSGNLTDQNEVFNIKGINGWISLFLYGANGHNCDDTLSHHPSYNPKGYVYGTTGQPTHYLNPLTRNNGADWGIRMGGDAEWFTMSREQWNYLLNDRPNAAGLRITQTTINGKKGLSLFPDKYSTSLNSRFGGTFSAQTPNATTCTASNSDNTWQRLENSGVVFLPAAGEIVRGKNSGGQNDRRTKYQGVNSTCRYWTSTGDATQNSVYNLTSTQSSDPSVAPSGTMTEGTPTNIKSAAVRLVYPANFTYDELQNAQSK